MKTGSALNPELIGLRSSSWHLEIKQKQTTLRLDKLKEVWVAVAF